MKQNITLSLDKDLIRKAKILAAQRNTSISRMLADELERILESSEKYARAKERALAALHEGFHLGGQGCPPREELHAR